jgi:hypothetical protein
MGLVARVRLGLLADYDHSFLHYGDEGVADVQLDDD